MRSSPSSYLCALDGAPNSSGLTGEEQETRPHFVTNVTHPTLDGLPPGKAEWNGYYHVPRRRVSWTGYGWRGYDMAPWFCGQGITYMVLKYRMPNYHWEVPVSDAEQAIRMVRQHAKEWNVNPYKVGLMGASAGGHLTATLATHYNSETRPDFQILLLSGGYDDASHPWKYKNCIARQKSNNGTNTEVFRRIASNARYSTSIYRSYLRRPFRSTLSRSELLPCFYRKTKVPATLHVYPTGGHGWGFKDHFKYKQQWTQELEKWLRDGVVFPENPEPMLRIGKSYLGTKYVANTLDQDGEESLVIRTDAVDCLTFVEYTLTQALGSSFADNLQKYVIGTASSTVILPGCIILPNG